MPSHRCFRAALAAVCCWAFPLAAQAPRDLVTRAVAALGGADALRNPGTVTQEFNAVTFGLGQEETPESAARATFAFGRTVFDPAGGRRVFEQELRTITGAVIRQRRVTAGGIGLMVTDGREAPDNPGAVLAVERSFRLLPERLLLAALDDPARVRALPIEDGRPGVRYAFEADTLDIRFDPVTALPALTQTVTDDPILGDRVTRTWFTRWQDAGGMRFPRQVDVDVNGRLAAHTVFTAVTVTPGVDAAVFAIPDSIAARAQRPTAPAPLVVTLTELAPNVWRAEGGSHHSLVIRQPDGLVLVEAPQHTARIRAVLDTLGRRFPGVPVTTVVNTHHHWDHAGGLRGAMAARVPTVVTHARNVAFIERIAAAPKTVSPDELSRTPGRPVIRAVTDTLTIGTGETRVVLRAIPSIHGEGILAAWLPASRILFTSDVLNPGTTLAPVGSRELLAFARAHGLTVDRYAGGHGRVVPWSEVVQAENGT